MFENFSKFWSLIFEIDQFQFPMSISLKLPIINTRFYQNFQRHNKNGEKQFSGVFRTVFTKNNQTINKNFDCLANKLIARKLF